jgi:signal transduction histidine kinase
LVFRLTNISAIIFIATLINFFTTYLSWQRRKTKVGYYFALGMVAITFWTLTAGLDYAATQISSKIFFAKLEVVFYNSALALYTLFALSYAGYDNWLKAGWVRALFWIVPATNILIPLTNELHGLFWTGFTWNTAGNNVLIFHHGPAFAWCASSNYAAALIMFACLWQAGRKSSDLTRRQARILISALAIPVLCNFLYLFEFPGLEGLDWTSIAFSISGLLFLMALYGTRLLDLVPIARHTIIEQMDDCVLVLDEGNRLVDFNRSARELFQINNHHIGSSIEAIAVDWPEIMELSLSRTKTTLQTTIINKDASKVFDTHLTPMFDSLGQLYGRLIVFNNVTKHHQIEQDLEQHLAEIQELHKNLQDTQEQVVAQQRTFAKLEERQRLGRDMHDSVNQSIHSLMLFSETLNSLLEKNQTEKALDVAMRIQESGRQALKEIRLLVFDTQSLLADNSKDLIRALEERLNMVERRVGIKAEIIYQGDAIVDRAPEWKENLYWMTIEALNNAIKHSQARKVQILISYTNKLLNVIIKDDGIGFNLNRIQNGGLGMRTMRERAELLHGDLMIESSPGMGTSICFKAETEAWYG